MGMAKEEYSSLRNRGAVKFLAVRGMKIVVRDVLEDGGQ